MKLVNAKYDIMAIYGNKNMPYSYTENPNILIEAAGRTCYKSEDKITDTSADKFVEMLKNRKHYAMIEHSWEIRSYTHRLIINNINNLPFLYKYQPSNDNKKLWLVGNKRAFEQIKELSILSYDLVSEDKVIEEYNITKDLNLLAMTVRLITDRGVTHESVRHRPPSYAQESSRYVNYGKKGCQFIIPCWVDDKDIVTKDISDLNINYPISELNFPKPYDDPITIWFKMMTLDTYAYNLLISKGWKPEQARSVLPNSTKTELVITASLAEWHHIFTLRTEIFAHPQMREVMRPLLSDVKILLPGAFDSIISY